MPNQRIRIFKVKKKITSHFEFRLKCCCVVCATTKHSHNLVRTVGKCVCLFYIWLFMFINEYQSSGSHTKQKATNTRATKQNTKSTFLILKRISVFFFSYCVTKNCAIVAGALAIATMTHFRMVLLILQHIRVFRATCKIKKTYTTTMNRNVINTFLFMFCMQKKLFSVYSQWCPPLFVELFAFSFFVINWLSSFSLICSRSRTISLSTLQINLKTKFSL